MSTLRHLHRSHLRAIPFENASVLRGEPIPLDLASLADKILARGRGGFCYELNGLFAALLEALGFSVRRRAARVFDGPVDVGPPLDHLCLEVEVDGSTWVADVGFGFSFLEPLRWTTMVEQDDPSGRFRLLERPNGDIDVELQHRDGSWRGHYRIEPGVHDLRDFESMCDYQRTSPNSSFLRGWICARATERGFVSLNDRKLSIGVGAEVVDSHVIDDDIELAEVLDRWFGIRPSGSDPVVRSPATIEEPRPEDS